MVDSEGQDNPWWWEKINTNRNINVTLSVSVWDDRTDDGVQHIFQREKMKICLCYKDCI